MKLHYFIVALLCLALFACKKQTLFETNNSYLENVKNELRNQLQSDDFKSLDFSKAVLSKVDSLHLYFLRIPLVSTKVIPEFVLVKTDARGIIETGKIIHLKRITANESTGSFSSKFDGTIIIHSLSRAVEVQSTIENGFIQSLHSSSNTRSAYVTPDPYIELPEVVIVSSYSSGGGISWSEWYSVMDLLGETSGGGGGGGNWYSSGDGGSYSGGGGGGGSTSSGTSGYSSGGDLLIKEPIYVSIESQINNPAISIQNFINCFNAIPDAGAVCKITIHSDLPVNGDPTKLFDFNDGSPGHTWLRFEKSNGSRHVSQHIGFYPSSDWKSITTSPVTGKFVDNGNHEFNASYELTITPAQLMAGLTRMQYLQKFVRYDLDDYNCTDWSLDVFNQVVRPEQMLTIPKYPIPGGSAPYGTSTPQGLFVELQQRLSVGGSQAAGISIPLVGYSGASSGACNPALVD